MTVVQSHCTGRDTYDIPPGPSSIGVGAGAAEECHHLKTDFLTVIEPMATEAAQTCTSCILGQSSSIFGVFDGLLMPKTFVIGLNLP